MDSLTQFVLGAGVGAAVMGRRLGPRKAALVGGVLGTLPDLDVLVPFDDPVDSFILHRGASHSLFVHAVVTPLIGEALVRLFKPLRDQRIVAYLAVFLCLTTHAVIDALTVYGTRVFWPVLPDPVGVGSIFIIDPLYTLPLLVAAVWALFLRDWARRFGAALAVCLALSTAYLGWGLVAQQVVQARATAVLTAWGIEPERLLAIPTPFNSVFWKAMAIDGDRYLNLYMPVFGNDNRMTAYAHPSGRELAGCLVGNESLEKLAWFSDGFYRVERQAEEIVVSDLRMGLTPNYAFRFAVAEMTAEGPRAIAPERRRAQRGQDGDLDWLLANLAGETALRPAEDGFVKLATAPPADGAKRAGC